MKKARTRPLSPRRPLRVRVPILLWGGIALAAWVGMQAWHFHRGGSFSPVLFGKGIVLLAAACAVFHSSAPRGFSFLGSFPLVWLAVSRFQWDLCALSDLRPWFWTVLFLSSLSATFLLRDGKKLVWVLVPIWGALVGLLRASFFLPLSFLTAPSGRFKRAPWIRWGGMGAVSLFFLIFQGWKGPDLEWYGLFDLLVTDRLVVFLLLGWLGLVAFPKKGTQRYAIFPLFWFLAGTVLWPGSGDDATAVLSVTGWVTVLLAGFGLESFRRDIMDPSWHGRAVWVAVGAALLVGVV